MPYQPALDGLRALAIACVIALHARLPFVPGGGIGVYVFFALSGFLITSLLLRELTATGSVWFWRFYLSRALRLLPALAVLLAVCTVWEGLFGSDPTRAATLRGVPPVVFYVANWARAVDSTTTLGLFGHTWTLAVEEQFYLLWPIVLAVLFRIGGWKLGLVMSLIGAALSLAVRLIVLPGTPIFFRVSGTDMMADQLLIGSATALALHHWRSGVGRHRLEQALRLAIWPAGGALVAVLLFFPGRFNDVNTLGLIAWSLTGFAVCSAVVVGYLVSFPTSTGARLLGWRPVAWVGRISYALYLWHFPVFYLLPSYQLPLRVSAPMGLAISVSLAACSYYLVERPALRFRQRLIAKRALARLGTDSGTSSGPSASALIQAHDADASHSQALQAGTDRSDGRPEAGQKWRAPW